MENFKNVVVILLLNLICENINARIVMDGLLGQNAIKLKLKRTSL